MQSRNSSTTIIKAAIVEEGAKIGKGVVFSGCSATGISFNYADTSTSGRTIPEPTITTDVSQNMVGEAHIVGPNAEIGDGAVFENCTASVTSVNTNATNMTTNRR